MVRKFSQVTKVKGKPFKGTAFKGKALGAYYRIALTIPALEQLTTKTPTKEKKF
jgi:hypothetical protein